METFIVVTTKQGVNSRADITSLEGRVIRNHVELSRLLENDFEYYSLSDFIEMCNTEEVTIEDYWTTYVLSNNLN